MGADLTRSHAPFRDPVGRFSSWVSACLACRFCLSPRFYPHLIRPAGRLLDGVPRFGGALLSLRRSRLGPKTRIAVCPIATVMLYLDASQCPLSPFPRCFQIVVMMRLLLFPLAVATQPASASGCCATVRTPHRSPTSGATAPPVSVPPQSPLASWRSSLLVRRSVVQPAADRCPYRKVPRCSAHRDCPPASTATRLRPMVAKYAWNSAAFMHSRNSSRFSPAASRTQTSLLLSPKSIPM